MNSSVSVQSLFYPLSFWPELSEEIRLRVLLEREACNCNTFQVAAISNCKPYVVISLMMLSTTLMKWRIFQRVACPLAISWQCGFGINGWTPELV